MGHHWLIWVNMNKFIAFQTIFTISVFWVIFHRLCVILGQQCQKCIVLLKKPLLVIMANLAPILSPPANYFSLTLQSFVAILAWLDGVDAGRCCAILRHKVWLTRLAWARVSHPCPGREGRGREASGAAAAVHRRGPFTARPEPSPANPSPGPAAPTSPCRHSGTNRWGEEKGWAAFYPPP